MVLKHRDKGLSSSVLFLVFGGSRTLSMRRAAVRLLPISEKWRVVCRPRWPDNHFIALLRLFGELATTLK